MVQALVEQEGPRSKRAVILAAAIDSFGHDGYEHTKWAKIAGQVGIGQTALFREVAADVPEADKALKLAVAAAYDVSPREVLQMRILQNHMDLLATPRPSEKEEVERQKAREHVREIEREWADLLERGMAAGIFPKRDAHALATVVLAMIVSVWRWYRPGGRMSLEDVRDLISDACLRVVGR